MQQLRGLAGGRHDVLVDGALVAGFQRAAIQRHRILDRQLPGFEASVGGGRSQVELRRVGGVLRGEHDILAAHGHVQAVLRAQRVDRAVDGDGTGTTADVDHAQFPAFQERMARRRRRFGLGRQGQRCVHRCGTTDHEALVVGVREGHRTGIEQAIEQGQGAQLVVAGTVDGIGMGGVVGLAVHGISSAGGGAPGSAPPG
ncbi:hypothetical protein G6F63_014560 [Rhizopus arrhizus]|nr:hypothetical protein G6F63_014560 [Rhizopus arrhizus]